MVVSFTIEPGQTRRGVPPNEEASEKEYVVPRPIRGLLKNHGYCLPDPSVPNRLSIWFSAGTIEVQNEEDLDEWKIILDPAEAPRRDLKEWARVMAARVLLGAHLPDGMAEDGTMRYTLKRPIGGHGEVFCDVIYADETLRVLRGHGGSIYVFMRALSNGEDSE